MAGQLLFLHWRAARWAMLPFVVAAFGLPLLMVQGLGGTPAAVGGADWLAFGFLETAIRWSPFFPLLAAITGTVLALTAWSWDHGADHVYALSLPLARWRYAGLKFGTGALLSLLPVAALGIGALLAVSAVSVPVGMNAYPGALTLRFLAATLTAYGFLFALASGTIRSTVILISVVLGVLLLGDPLLEALSNFVPGLAGVRFAPWVVETLSSWPSPLQIFTDNWFLFDV